MRSPFLVLFLVGFLAGCGNSATGPTGAVNRPVSRADLAALEVSTTEAIRLANRCLELKVGPCGDPASRLAIIADEHKAVDAFRCVQSASAADQPAAVALANEALAQLTAVTPPIPAGK